MQYAGKLFKSKHHSCAFDYASHRRDLCVESMSATRHLHRADWVYVSSAPGYETVRLLLFFNFRLTVSLEFFFFVVNIKQKLIGKRKWARLVNRLATFEHKTGFRQVLQLKLFYTRQKGEERKCRKIFVLLIMPIHYEAFLLSIKLCNPTRSQPERSTATGKFAKCIN